MYELKPNSIWKWRSSFLSGQVHDLLYFAHYITIFSLSFQAKVWIHCWCLWRAYWFLLDSLDLDCENKLVNMLLAFMLLSWSMKNFLFITAKKPVSFAHTLELPHTSRSTLSILKMESLNSGAHRRRIQRECVMRIQRECVMKYWVYVCWPCWWCGILLSWQGSVSWSIGFRYVGPVDGVVYCCHDRVLSCCYSCEPTANTEWGYSTDPGSLVATTVLTYCALKGNGACVLCSETQPVRVHSVITLCSCVLTVKTEQDFCEGSQKSTFFFWFQHEAVGCWKLLKHCDTV